MTTPECKNLLRNVRTSLESNIARAYKNVGKETENNIAQEAKAISQKFCLEDRINNMVKIEAFIILNGHKDNFPNNPTCRLINPTRSEFGKVSKQLLTKINDTVVRQTNINLWRNTVVVINWSRGNRAKDKCSFISFDIVNFYLSINAE